MAFYSNFWDKYANDLTLGLVFSSAMIFGGISAFNFYNKTGLTALSEFPNDKKLSVSLEDYASIKGKTPDDYDMLQIYKCDQIIHKNTEMIVESKSLEGKCAGLALTPK